MSNDEHTPARIELPGCTIVKIESRPASPEKQTTLRFVSGGQQSWTDQTASKTWGQFEARNLDEELRDRFLEFLRGLSDSERFIVNAINRYVFGCRLGPGNAASQSSGLWLVRFSAVAADENEI